MSARESGSIVIGIGGMVWTLVLLFAWALYKEAQVHSLRLVGRYDRAKRVELQADKDFRQLMGVPEPGEPWDY